MLQSRLAVAGVGIALIGLTACSDPTTSPSTSVVRIPTKSSAIVAPAAPENGRYYVCKVGAVGNFTVTGGDVASLTLNQSSADPSDDCALVAEATGSENLTVTVTEVPTSGTEFVSVNPVVTNNGSTTPIVSGQSVTFNFTQYHGIIVTYTNRVTEETGNEGCTPGYWKQIQHSGNWPTDPNTSFSSIFGDGIFDGSLADALVAKGGGTQALARHAAAAYLNALSNDVDYAYTLQQVIDIATRVGAYDDLTVEEAKDLLVAANEGVGGCPLARSVASE